MVILYKCGCKMEVVENEQQQPVMGRRLFCRKHCREKNIDARATSYCLKKYVDLKAWREKLEAFRNNKP